MRQIIISGVIVLMALVEISAQQNLAIGEWKSHLPQQFGQRVTQSADKIIYANAWNLIIIDKEEFSADFMSKVDGLSDIGIEQIEYDELRQQLIVVYTNSNIDIISQEGRVVNIPNIKENTSILGDKTINKIYTTISDRFYLATGFGIIEMDANTLNFGSTVFMGIRVDDILIKDEHLYAATEEGLYRVSLASDINFSDFTLWEYISGDTSTQLPQLEGVKSLTTYNDAIYLATSNKVYRSRGDDLTFEAYLDVPENQFAFSFLDSQEGYLVIAFDDGAFESQVEFHDQNGSVLDQKNNCSNRAFGVELDKQGRVWYADGFNNIRYSEQLGSDCKTLSYNSPYHHSVSDIDIKDNKVLVSDGGVSDNYQYLFSRQGFYIRTDDDWTNYNEFSNPEIGQNDLLSFFRIKAHPNVEKTYVGSYWGGLLELDQTGEQDIYTVYTQENSSIQGTVGDEARERITGIAFDESENLWVTTFGAARPLNVMTPEGQWTNFAVNSSNLLTNITIDEFGHLWCPVSAGGVLVYDCGEDPSSSSDDRQRVLNVTNSELTTNRVNVVTVDRDGAVWVGTDEGPVIFDCGSGVFDNDCQGVRKKVLQDSIAAFLLADQEIRAIEVDGANQKWFGTNNGLFVQSEDGEVQIARFTTDNSPLFDNIIQDIAYDGASGQMYIGTNKGLISYQTSTTEPATRHRSSDVLVYPNPVQPDYSGPIAIRGLIENAEVKITDINGHLVYQTNALGGQAIWSGNDYDDNRVSSGVYLVFSSNGSTRGNPDTFVAKILLLR